MLSLDKRLDKAEEMIRKPSFRENKGLGNEVGYYIFDYPAEKELYVRERIDYIKKKNETSKDLQFFDIGTKNYAEVSGKEISQRNALIYAIKHKETEGNKFKEAFKYVVEEVAYTWFNRLIAIRFMEVNDYLPSGIRVLSSENKAKNEPDFVTSPFDTDLEFTPYEQDRVVQLKDENKLDELFRMLFIKQCNKLHDILPELFEKTDDYTELLLTTTREEYRGVYCIA